MNNQRLSRCQISFEFLADILACRISGNVTTNAPKDLKIISMDQSIDGGAAWMIIESESFAEVSEGMEIPVIVPFKYEKNGCRGCDGNE